MKQQLKIFHRMIIILVSFILVTGCHRYYKSITRNITDHPDQSLDSLKKDNRYFVLRTPDKAWHIWNIVLSEDRKTIKGMLEPVPVVHQVHLDKGKGKRKYKEEYVLSEVHLYIDNDSLLKEGDFTLALNRIQKVEVIEKDKKRTTNSYVIGAVGYTVGAFAVAVIIIAATKSSCPFVSAYTNNEFVLQGEIYGGAIYPQLARDDYMPLQMQPTINGTMQIKISNELQERQYTDFADLLVITHDINTKVLSDEKGNLYSIAQPQSPLSAWTENQADVLPALLYKDDNSLLHFDDTLAVNATNYVITRFKNPGKTEKAKLILSLKNSYWLDYLYGELAKSFGSYYATYVKKQNKKPAAELIKWAEDEQIPLQVSIKTKTGWQKIANVNTIGPLATRQIVVPVDLSNITDEVIEIKLSSGFMFWEIDYEAMDFSEDTYFKVDTLSPSKAIDETGKNVLPLLVKKDGLYLEQPVPGNVVTLEYDYKPISENESRSYLLHTKGYYTHVRNLKGAPKVSFLEQFKKPGAFPLYSLQLYKKFSITNMASLAQQ